MKSRSTRRSQKSSSPGDDITERSTAAIFRGVDPAATANGEKEPRRPLAEAVKNSQAPIQQQEEEAGFPFNYLYQFQDFLELHMSVLKGAQLLVFGFFVQLVYLKQANFEHLKTSIPMLFYNWVGITACIVLSAVKSKDSEVKPPDFNYFYSVLIPALLNTLYYDPSWFLINCSLNYFTVDKMHPIFNLISSVVFYEIYREDNESTIPTVQFVQLAVAQFFFIFVLNDLNDRNGSGSSDTSASSKSLRKPEIQLISMLLVNVLFNQVMVKDELPLVVFQKLLSSLIVASFLLYPVHGFLNEWIAMAAFGAVFCFLAIFQLNLVLGENALFWLRDYILQVPERVYIFKVWIIAASVSIPLVFYIAGMFNLNTRRKIWHILVILALTFTPSVLFNEIDFTLIALLGMIIVFLIVEGIRLNNSSYLGQALSKGLAQFQDMKDSSGTLNLSYIYLLTGVTFPVVYDYLVNRDKVTIIRYVGLISLGVGDTLASIIGQRFGSLKWKGSEKSVQGTAAFIISCLLAFNAVEHINSNNPKYVPIANWENAFVSLILGGVLEGVANINDNYLVPVFIPIAFDLLNRCY
ncbi:uncharacterized protein LODBEIA_P22880 [Lodderomyces beijingensis]|uniref:dolichol kinase n=1 Tax=Lodderomyces beijingensis TaxID=1775926 RepID=A0ABP0ZIU7_9ASCO